MQQNINGIACTTMQVHTIELLTCFLTTTNNGKYSFGMTVINGKMSNWLLQPNDILVKMCLYADEAQNHGITYFWFHISESGTLISFKSDYVHLETENITVMNLLTNKLLDSGFKKHNTFQ